MTQAVRAVCLMGGALALLVTAVDERLLKPVLVSVLVTIGVVASAWWYRHDRLEVVRHDRLSKGQCATSGYNLKDNLSGVCPECGAGA